jgi:hypothetical protein
VLSANRTESLALLENGAHRSRKSTVKMRIENKRPDFDLVGRNEKHLPQFHNDKQRNTQRRKLAGTLTRKIPQIQMQKGRPNQAAQHKKMQHKFFN